MNIARSIKHSCDHRARRLVGVAPNKLVAKIASELEKPDGLTVVTSANLRALRDP